MANLKEGLKAPKFKLPDQDGKTVSLDDYKGKTVILYFYPKDLTSGCTQQAKDFTKEFPKFKSKKAVILGVSPDSSEMHRKFIDKIKIGFDLLADEEKKVSKAYGVYQKKKLYGREYMGIVRTTFVISPDGKIAKIFPKVKVNGHIQKVLESL